MPLSAEILDAAKKANLSKITLGIRPEAMRPVTAGSLGKGAIQMETTLVEELGADAYVYGSLPGDDPLTDKQFVVRVAGLKTPRIGEMVTLEVDANAEHAFNPDTGERLGGASSL